MPIYQNRNNSSSQNKKNANKNRYKSPEIILGKNKLKNSNFNTIQNENYNDDININHKVYRSGFGFYHKKEDLVQNKSV